MVRRLRRAGGHGALRVLGVLLLDVLLELVAAVLAVGAVRALVLRLAAALQRHVAHQVLARVVAALAVGAAVALLSLVLRARQRHALAARVDVVGRAALAGRPRRRLGLGGRRLLVLLAVLQRGRRRRLHRLQYRERGRGGRVLLLRVPFAPSHDTVPRRRFPICNRKLKPFGLSVLLAVRSI